MHHAVSPPDTIHCGLGMHNELFHISTICTYVECVEIVTLSPAVLGFGIASETIETQYSHDWGEPERAPH